VLIVIAKAADARIALILIIPSAPRAARLSAKSYKKRATAGLAVR
jgi:hypothetical protein